MNVWLVNPFDPLPGEQFRAGRYAFFAKLLGEAGHTVTWWTSAFCHATKSYRDSRTWEGRLPDGVNVAVLWAPPYYQNTSVRRLINHFIWARAFFKEACRTSLPPHVIIAGSPPLYSTNRSLRVAHLLNAKVVVDVIDLWPEAFTVVFPFPVRWLGVALLQPLRALEDANFRQADGLIAISQTLLSRALSAAPEQEIRCVIPSGVDLEVFEQATRSLLGWQKPSDEFWVIYIGTVGRTYDIETILQAARLLKGDELRIKFLIAGSGPLLQVIQEKACHWGLSNVVFTGFLPLDRLAQLLIQADTGLNAIAPGTVSAFPRKIFDYMAAGLPVISSVKGELEAFIQQHGIGVSYEAGQAESLREAILTLYKAPELRAEMGTRARQLAREQFDIHVTYGILLELLEKAVSR